MSRGKTGGAGTPVPSIEREKAGGRPAPCTTRKITFAEALAMGMPAREALEKSDPARMKDITDKGLQACVDAGLTKEEIARGYGTTKSSLGWQACQLKFKFPKGYQGFTPEVGGVTPKKTTPENVQGGGTDVQLDVQPAAAGPVEKAMSAFIGTDKLKEIEKVAAANHVAAAHTPTPAELTGLFESEPQNDVMKIAAKVVANDFAEKIAESLGGHRPRKVYVAHPLRGPQLQANVDSATAICREYAECRDIIPFSPIHAFGFLDPMTYDQTHGMAMCFALLASCDELWVHGTWWTSEGCLAEICFAIMRGIPVRFVTVHPVIEGRQLA